MQQTAKKLSPIVSDETKIEVSIENDQALIKQSTWVENLGWCGQKTMQIDVDMLDDLHRAITAARYKVNRQKVANNEEIKESKVIEFPSIS